MDAVLQEGSEKMGGNGKKGRMMEQFSEKYRKNIHLFGGSVMGTAIPCRTRDLYFGRTADPICTQGESVNVPLAARSVGLSPRLCAVRILRHHRQGLCAGERSFVSCLRLPITKASPMDWPLLLELVT